MYSKIDLISGGEIPSLQLNVYYHFSSFVLIAYYYVRIDFHYIGFDHTVLDKENSKSMTCTIKSDF